MASYVCVECRSFVATSGITHGLLEPCGNCGAEAWVAEHKAQEFFKRLDGQTVARKDGNGAA